MDERSDRGEFYPGGNGRGGVPPGTATDKVDRISLGEVGESYTLKDVKQKVNQIVRAIAPVAVCIALCACAATAPLEDIPNTAPVVTNEEDAVAIAAVGALGAAVSNRVEAAEGALQAEIAGATNAVVQAALRAAEAESNRVDATYAKRSEIPAAPDLSPYALKSELPQDYLTESDITNFATRAWISAQGYATEAGVGARLDAQDLAIDAATNALWLAHAAGLARLVAATNALWSATQRADERLQRAIDGIRIVAADSNAVTRLVTEDGRTWQDATGVVWRVSSVSNVYGWAGTVVDIQTSAARPITFYYAGKTSTAPNVYTPADYWSAGAGTNLYFDADMMLDWGLWMTNDYHGYTNAVWQASDTQTPTIAATNLSFNTSFELYTLSYQPVALSTNAVDRVLYASGGGATDLTPATNYTDQVAARKQDALPYPTNAIPYAAISGAPSGGAEWRVVAQECGAIRFVTNGMSVVRFAEYDPLQLANGASPENSGWPDGAAMFSRWLIASEGVEHYWPSAYMRLVGYGTWPTNDCQCVWWRSGTNIFVRVLYNEVEGSPEAHALKQAISTNNADFVASVTNCQVKAKPWDKLWRVSLYMTGHPNAPIIYQGRVMAFGEGVAMYGSALSVPAEVEGTWQSFTGGWYLATLLIYPDDPIAFVKGMHDGTSIEGAPAGELFFSDAWSIGLDNNYPRNHDLNQIAKIVFHEED